MIYKNDNIIEKDNYAIGTIKDLKEYFRYQIASQCITGEEEQDGFINEIRNICDLLEVLNAYSQIHPGTTKIKVSKTPMGSFIMEREG